MLFVSWPLGTRVLNDPRCSVASYVSGVACHLSHTQHEQGCASVYKVSLRIMHSARRASSSSSSSLVNSVDPDVSSQRDHKMLLVPLQLLLCFLLFAICGAACADAENQMACVGTCRR